MHAYVVTKFNLVILSSGNDWFRTNFILTFNAVFKERLNI